MAHASGSSSSSSSSGSAGAGTRVRLSLVELARKYDSDEDPKPLENLMTAWEGFKARGYKEKNSFFNIAGYHGQPYRGEGETDANYWGGFCQHGNILFPVWHRAYLWDLEEALRSVSGETVDVTLPFWDQVASAKDPVAVIPWPLTDEKFKYKSPEKKGKEIDNPLRSFKFPVAITSQVQTPYFYSKPEGYDTVRYPLAGLYGTPADAQATAAHNAQFPDYKKNVITLNGNVRMWLNQPTFVPNGGDPKNPVEANLVLKYINCLDAPTYTLFSNTTSAGKYNYDKPSAHVVPLESPHNGMHLALGGFEMPGYNRNVIKGASGDMGENDTAGLDPIFYFHHCFIDYVFWQWQLRRGQTEKLEIDVGYEGTFAGSVGQAPVSPPEDYGTPLDLESDLLPFRMPDESRYVKGSDVINIKTIYGKGFSYGPGSLDWHPLPGQAHYAARAPQPHPGFKIQVPDIHRLHYSGSFVIYAYVEVNGEKKVLGFEPVLSRFQIRECQNCQTHLAVNASFAVHAPQEAVPNIEVGVLSHAPPAEILRSLLGGAALRADAELYQQPREPIRFQVVPVTFD